MSNKCTDCGKTLTKEDLKYNDDMCLSCVAGLAFDVDVEMFGEEDAAYFHNAGIDDIGNK